MAISVGLSFGVVTGVAAALGLPLYAVPPKVWQHPVVCRQPGDRRKVEFRPWHRDRQSRRAGSMVLQR